MKPIRKTSLLLIFLFTLSMNAQKVKVKKGEVLIDKVAVATVKSVGNTHTFKSLNNDNTIIVESHALVVTKELTKKWITVFTADKSKSSEVEMEYFSISMNSKKQIAELLIKKYSLITTNGVENIDAFFTEDRPNLTEQFNGLVSQEVAIRKEIKNLNINVDYNYKKISEGSKGIGSYTSIRNTGPLNGQIYTIYDLDRNKVAIASPSSFGKIMVSLPFAKKEFSYKSSIPTFQETSAFDGARFVKEIVGQLYLNDVTLAHQVNSQKKLAVAAKREQVKEYRKNELETAKEASANIYKKPGYVFASDGEKRQGTISIMFDDLYNKMGKKLTEYNLKRMEKVILFTPAGEIYKSAEQISAEKGTKFCVINDDNSKSCYRGVKTNLPYRFFEILNENKDSKVSLYKRPSSNTQHAIAINGREKGFMFVLYSKKRNIKKLTEYIACPELAERLPSFDYKKEKDIIELIKIYNSSCK